MKLEFWKPQDPIIIKEKQITKRVWQKTIE